MEKNILRLCLISALLYSWNTVRAAHMEVVNDTNMHLTINVETESSNRSMHTSSGRVRPHKTKFIAIKPHHTILEIKVLARDGTELTRTPIWPPRLDTNGWVNIKPGNAPGTVRLIVLK